MATNTTTYLLKTAVDTAELDKASYAFRQVEKIFKATGNTVDQQSKIFNFAVSEMKNNTVKLTGAVKTADGKLQNFSGTFKKFSQGAAQGLSAIPQAANVTTQSLKALGAAGTGASISMSSLLAKSLQGIFIYRVLGASFTFITSAIGSAIKFMIDYELQLARVRVASNDTKENIDKLGASALTLAAKFGVSFTELGDALETFAQLGLNSTQILSQLGPVLAFTSVSGRKAGDVVQDLIAIQASYNLTLEDTQSILDSITKVQLKYSITTDQLAAGLRKFAPAASAVGFTLSETIGLITGVQEQTRKSGEEVGTALSNLSTRLESVDIVGKLQGIVDVPLFMDEAGKATAEFTGRVRPASEILAILASRFKDLSTSGQASLAAVFGGRQRFTDATVALQNYDTILNATIDSLNSYGSLNEAAAKIQDTVANSLNRTANSFLEGLNVARPFFDTVIKGALEGAKAIADLNTQVIKLLVHHFDPASDAKDFANKSLEAANVAATKEEKRKQAVAEIVEKYKELVSVQKQFEILTENSSEKEKKRLLELQSKVVAQNSASLNKLASNAGIKADFSANTISDLIGKTGDVAAANSPNFALNRQVEEQAKKRKEEGQTDVELQTKLKNLEEELTAQGKARAVILKAQRDLIAQTEGLQSKAIVDFDRKRKLEEDQLKNKSDIAKFEVESNIQVQEAIALGATALEIEKLKLKLANDLAVKQGDVNQQALIELKTRQAIAEQVAKSSQDLQNSVKGGISNLLQGKGTLADIGTGFQDTVKKGFADAISSSITKDLFAITGIGDTFGGLTTSIENNINALERNTNALLGKDSTGVLSSGTSKTAGGLLSSAFGGLASLLGLGGNKNNTGTIGADFFLKKPLSPNDIEDIVAQGITKDSSGGGGILGGISSGLKGLFDKITGSLGSFLGGSGGSGSFSGLGSAIGGIGAGFGAFQSAKKGDIFGATAQGALAGGQLGGGYGAIIGGALGFLGSLFHKPKTTVDIQEQTKQFQVSSRIDVTNKKLDTVNRNLVALKQTFETIVLPDSAFLGTKRSLEDQFSVNSRRGIF